MKQFYQQYVDINKRWPASKSKFNKRVGKVIGAERERKMVDLERDYVWRFPPLSDCRAKFAKYMEADIDWPSASDEQKYTPAPKERRKF